MALFGAGIKQLLDELKTYLDEGKRLSDYHIDLYRRVVHTIGYTRNFNHRILNILILKSNYGRD
mgnify:CR=1 FL=1